MGRYLPEFTPERLRQVAERIAGPTGARRPTPAPPQPADRQREKQAQQIVHQLMQQRKAKSEGSFQS